MITLTRGIPRLLLEDVLIFAVEEHAGIPASFPGGVQDRYDPGLCTASEREFQRQAPAGTGRHRDLEPGPFTGFPRFRYRDSGNGKDLPAEEKPEAGVLPKAPLEDHLLLIRRDAFTIVITYEEMIVTRIHEREPD